MTARIAGIHALPPGVDFAAELATGLIARLGPDAPPEAMAQVLVIVNTPQLRTRLTEALAATGPTLLPRMLTPDELADALLPGQLPPAVPSLRRRLEVQQLIARLLAADPGLAPRARLQDLAESLGHLIDEMQAEGVAPGALAALEVGDHAAHWSRMQAFLRVIATYLDGPGPPDPEARLAATVGVLAAGWPETASGPVVMAGSTGSRGNVARLMAVVAGLPQGALVLPGFDFTMPPQAWAALGASAGAEDHPQGRHQALLAALGVGPDAVGRWTNAAPADPARAALVSLALRPAPVTDRWRLEGPALGDTARATRGLTLIEAPSPRAEALAIALRLRRAVHDGQRAALVTPDRMLARQVTAALDRWRIVPDDSAGVPLNQTAPGRLVRMIAAMRARPVTLEALLSLLKHPLVQAGGPRGAHLRHTRALELRLRRHGPAFPDRAALVRWARLTEGAEIGGNPETGTAPLDWAEWLGGLIDDLAGDDGPDGRDPPCPLAIHVAKHRALLDRAAGPEAGLWEGPAGTAVGEVLDELAAEAEHGGQMTAADHAELLGALLSARSVREDVRAHPLVAIRGVREARLHSADVVILGGLVEGVWPAAPPADPWLSRPMRRAAGLAAPERRVGLAAHDFEQAIAAREVVLTRALRGDEAETVPSRWLNRLVYLLHGLAETGGPEALRAMRARGDAWVALATRLETPAQEVARAPRPAPAPPRRARPNQLSVTEIQTLIRDPYAIYARHVLRLKPLDPLTPSPDPRLRGTVMHRILEMWLRSRPDGSDTPEQAQARLLAAADEVLAQDVPWPSARQMWRARIEAAAGGLIALDAEAEGAPLVIERLGVFAVPGTGLRLTGKPDRIDRLADGGGLQIIDYKTGALPSDKEIEHFDKQLPLLTLMVRAGAFVPPGPAPVARARHVRVAAPVETKTHVFDEAALAEVQSGLTRLIARYLDPEQGFAASRALKKEEDEGPYDQLARRGEWDGSDAPTLIRLGADDAS